MGTSEDGLIGIPFPEHSSEILCRLNEQRRAGLLCDVTIKTRGLEYRSHRAVLAAVSQYFHKLFTSGGGRSGGFGGGGGPRSVCQLDCVDPEALAALLEFAYTATLTIRTSSMRGVLRAARLLEIQCVTDACLDILRSSGEEEEEEDDEEAAKEESKRDLGLEGEGRYETDARFPQGFPDGFPDGFVRENGRPASEEEGSPAPQRQVQMGGGRGGRGGRSRGSPRRPRKRVDNRLPLPLLHPVLKGAALDYSLRERERERERERALGSSVIIPRATEDLDREGIEDYEGGRGERNGFSFNESTAYNGWRFRTAADHERLSVEEEEEEEEGEEEEGKEKGFAHPGPQLPEPAGLPFSFPSAGSPQLPDKAVRKRKSQTPQQCPVCQKIIHGAGKLPRHMRTHTGEKPFQCGTCGVRFTRNDKLKIHMRKHTGERPYCCPHCSARFLHSYDLKNHLSLHSGDRPFECTLCHKAFAREDHLQRHLKGQNCLEVRTRKPRRAGGGGGGAGLVLEEESQPLTLLQQGYPAPLLSRSPLPSFVSADGRLWSPGTSTPPSPTPNGPWEGPDSSEEPL